MPTKKQAVQGPIVQVLARLYYGGAEILAKNLAEQYASAGRSNELWIFYRAAAISPGDDAVQLAEDTMLEELRHAGVVCRFLDKKPGGSYLPTWRNLRRLAKQIKPSLVHVHLEEISFHTTVALTGSRIPIVQTIHSTLVRRSGLLRHYFKRRHKRFIAISHDVMDVLSEHGITQPQAVYIRNGIRTARFANDRDSARPVREIVSVASLTPVKNHELLIKAMGLLRDRWIRENRNPDILPKVRFIGEGILRPKLESLINELNLGSYFLLSGASNQVHEDLKQADIFTLASDYEGISIALMEGMASLLPITVTNMTGAKELIRHRETGTVVDIGSHEQMADAWYELILDSNLRQHYARNIQADVPSLDLSYTSDHYLQVYDEILTRRV